MPSDVQEAADSRRLPQYSLGINLGPQFPHRVVFLCNNREDNQCLQCLTTSRWCRPHGSILMPSFLSSFTNSAVRGYPKVTLLNIRAPSAMGVLHATGDIRSVSLWLGHADIKTTEMSLRGSPAEKLAILNANTPPSIRSGTFPGAKNSLMSLLNGK